MNDQIRREKSDTPDAAADRPGLYSAGFDPAKTHLCIGCHEQVLVDPLKGVTYLSPVKKELTLIRGA